MLVLVQLFVAIFPFLYLTLLKPYYGVTCPEEGESFEDLVWNVYGVNNNWPSGIGPAPMVNGTFLDHGSKHEPMPWLRAFILHGFGRTCLLGCLPKTCIEGRNGVLDCETDCVFELKSQLSTVFVVLTGISILFTMMPIVTARITIQAEIEGAKLKMGKAGSKWCNTFKAFFEAPRSTNAEGIEQLPYTMLQFQAKMSEVAKYEYGGGGGSRVEDFMDLAISFTLVTCFSIHLPLICIMAFVN